MDASVVIRIVIVIVLIVAIVYIQRSRKKTGEGPETETKKKGQRPRRAKAPKEVSPTASMGGAVEIKTGGGGGTAEPSPPPKREPGIDQRVVPAGDVTFATIEAIAEEPKGRVVLVHGFGGDKSDWLALLRYLQHSGFDAWAPDLPGFGGTRAPADQAWDLKALVRSLRLFTKAVGISRFHLIGASLGATLAAGYAYAAPKQVLSLTLIEPIGLRVPYESDLDKALAQGENPLVIDDPADFDQLQAFLHARPPELAGPVAMARAGEAVARAEVERKILHALRAGDHPHILDLILPDVELYTLILQGEESRVVHPATADVAADIMTRARSFTFPGVGHRPMVEAPEDVAQVVLDFLKRVSGG